MVSYHDASDGNETDGERSENEELKKEVLTEIESIKWYLWNGNAQTALDKIDDCFCLLDTDETTAKQKTLLQTVGDFQTYISKNRSMITNYGERYRNGEAIATGFVEFAVNHRQKICQKTADALDKARGAYVITGQSQSSQWRVARKFQQVVSAIRDRESCR